MCTILAVLLVSFCVAASASYSSVSYALSSASSCDPSIYSIGTILSTIEFSSPSVSAAESIIESYEYSSPSVVSFLESDIEYPSVISSPTLFYSEVSEYSSLYAAISTIDDVIAICPSLSAVQSTLQSVMQSDSSILYQLSQYTYYVSPSIVSASNVIDQATIVSSSAFSDDIALSLYVAPYPSVSYAICELSYYAYTLPSTVVSDIVSFVSSPSTVAPSVVSYIYDYYPSIYPYAYTVESFVISYPEVDPWFTDEFYVDSCVSSFSSAVSYVEYYQMPTFYYQASVISSVEYTWPSVSTDLSYLSILEASSSSLGYAFSAIENTFYNSPAIASSLYEALVSPSTVVDTQLISYEEMSHQSFVSALDTILSFQSAYPSYSLTISYVLYYASSAFETASTLLTANSYISALISSSTASATYSLLTDLTVISSESTILSAVSYATYYSPTLSCYESVAESYAYNYPSVIYALWNVITEPSLYFTQASTYASLEASYPVLVNYLEYIYSAAYSYSSLYSYEGSFLLGAEYDSELLTEYYEVSQAMYYEASSLWWYSSSYSS
jgi:epidermal growth factor receptor substrate 15